MKRQRIALVPVGAVGLDELMSLMSQYVVSFIREADTYVMGGGDRDLAGLVADARANAVELFSRFRLHGVAKQGKDGFSFSRPADATAVANAVALPVNSLVNPDEDRPGLPNHIFCTGPLFLENWSDFEKRELFSFEGWETQTNQTTRRLFMQLRDIDENRTFPAALRIPASNLFRLLARDKPGAANEFTTIKDLKSPNTWIAVPIAYSQFMTSPERLDDRVNHLVEPEMWREALGRTLSGNGAVMPPIARYEEFPWVAAVGQIDPLRLDVVFDDRYFMASNELNLLNTILLAETQCNAEGITND